MAFSSVFLYYQRPLYIRNGDLGLVLLHGIVFDALAEHVHIRRREFPRADLLLEQEVQLGKRATRRLWYAEIRVHEA